MKIQLPISDKTWNRLTTANEDAVRAGWAQPGVFATAVGPEYATGHPGSLLYIGKSAGPLAGILGSSMDQQASARASAKWMEERKNKRSHFWQFIEQIDPTRRRIAWTNVCKMDRVDGMKPPSNLEFAQVAGPCMRALNEEIVVLAPQVTVFATSGLYDYHVRGLLARIGYQPSPLQFDDGWTSCARSPEGRFAIMTKHPQGWVKEGRRRVIDLLMALLKGAVQP